VCRGRPIPKWNTEIMCIIIQITKLNPVSTLPSFSTALWTHADWAPEAIENPVQGHCNSSHLNSSKELPDSTIGMIYGGVAQLKQVSQKLTADVVHF
jgi:hypothetical protein